MLAEYFPILLFIAVGLAVGVAPMVLGRLLGPHRPDPEKLSHVGEPLEVYVKGKAEKVRIREVIGIPSLGKEVPRQEIRRSPRVEVRLPFRYQLLRGKEIMAELYRGVIRDIGYHGLLAEFDQPLELYAELKLSVELLQVSHEAKDVYARVVKLVPRENAFLAGVEFTSLSAVDDAKIQLFVQMALQGEERE
jgi:adenylate cyclase